MAFLIFGKPLVLWLGLITLISFIFQIYLGYKLTHGYSNLFSIHRLNAFILTFLVIMHLVLGLLLYF